MHLASHDTLSSLDIHQLKYDLDIYQVISVYSVSILILYQAQLV